MHGRNTAGTPGLSVDLDDWRCAGLLRDVTVARDQQSQAREAAFVSPVAALEVP